MTSFRFVRALVPGLVSVVAGALLTGCFLVTDVDKFKEATPNNSPFYDLDFTIRGADSHVAEVFEIRVVDKANENIVAILRQDPLGGPESNIRAPLSLPKGQNLKLVFWADHNKTGKFDKEPTPFDHSWTVDVEPFKPKDPADNLVKIVYDHNTQFVDVVGKSIGNDAEVSFTHMMGFAGKRLQVSIADANSKQTVGVYRVTKIASDDITVKLPGVVDPGAETKYDVWVTLDDGTIAANGLEGYRLQKTTSATGLKFDFDPVRDQGTRTSVGVPKP